MGEGAIPIRLEVDMVYLSVGCLSGGLGLGEEGANISGVGSGGGTPGG